MIYCLEIYFHQPSGSHKQSNQDIIGKWLQEKTYLLAKGFLLKILLLCYLMSRRIFPFLKNCLQQEEAF